MKNPKDILILVVDDDEILRETIAFDFKRKGFNVFLAENGVKAFELVKANSIQLVISDIRMPEGDGIELLDKIRSINPNNPIVILITGFADITEDECIRKGANKVFSKPFDRKILMNSAMESLGLSTGTKAA